MKQLFLFVAALVAVNLSQAQWGPDVRLTNSPDSSITTYGYTNCIAASRDTVHVIWYDKRDGNTEIYYKRSIDGGLTWSQDNRLTIDPNRSSLPSISVSGSFVHVVWKDTRDGNNGEIYYKQSPDGGTTWGSDKRLTFDPAYSSEPSVSAINSIVHIIWNDKRDGNSEIYYKRSTDGGSTWGPDTRLTNDLADSYNCSMAVSGQHVHVVWNDKRDGNFEIYYKQSADGGIIWGQDTRLTNTSLSSQYPSIAASGSNVHIVWSENQSAAISEIYYKQSLDDGITWSTNTELTNEGVVSTWSNVTASGSMVHVVWQNNLNVSLSVFYKSSNDGGVNWSTETQLNDVLASSQHPSIVVSGPVLHVVWYDLRDLNYEIYYKRNPTGGFPVGIENEPGNSIGQQIRIYPNPASNILNIVFGPSLNTKIALRFTDIFGKTFRDYRINYLKGMEQYSLDVSNFPDGLYFIEFNNGSQIDFRKIIISK